MPPCGSFERVGDEKVARMPVGGCRLSIPRRPSGEQLVQRIRVVLGRAAAPSGVAEGRGGLEVMVKAGAQGTGYDSVAAASNVQVTQRSPARRSAAAGSRYPGGPERRAIGSAGSRCLLGLCAAPSGVI